MEADLCYGFSTTKWKQLEGRLDHDGRSWEEAINVFKSRMKERFFTCIEALVKADTKPGLKPSSDSPPDGHCIPGFSIMALCCLLIETLQGFRENVPTAHQPGPCNYPNGRCIKAPPDTTGHFIKFLRRPAFGRTFAEDTIAKSFVRGIRNGILHEAETRKWVIWRNMPDQIVAPREDGNVLNRTLFYEALKEEFESYIRDLHDPAMRELRERFREKMNDICNEA